MEISVSDAKAQLTDLVRRAEAGEAVILTRHGHPVARLVPAETKPPIDATRRLALLQELSKRAATKAKPGPETAKADAFLYGDDGMPR